MTESSKDFDAVTKTIHLGMATVLPLQMVGGLFVHDPHTLLYLYVHEYVGILAIVILLARWLWIYTASQTSVLFPWGSAGRKKVLADFRNLRSGILPDHQYGVGLPGFWHGIGLIVYSVLAATGLVLLFVLPGHHSVLGVSSHNFHLYTETSLIHKAASYLGWVYLAGHIGLAIFHQVAGDNVLGKMFFLGGRRSMSRR